MQNYEIFFLNSNFVVPSAPLKGSRQIRFHLCLVGKKEIYPIVACHLLF